MNKNKFSHKIKEIPPPQPPSDSNEVILDLESGNKENVSPGGGFKSKKTPIQRTFSDNKEQKNYKEMDKNLMPMFSLKSGDSNFSPIKWLLNSLTKMQLNMNVCYEIIENMDLDSAFDKESTLNTIIEKYFLKIKDFSNEPRISGSNFKITQSLIYKKMFMKKKKAVKNKKDVLLAKNQKGGILNEVDLKFSPTPLVPKIDFSPSKCPICYENFESLKRIPGSNHEFCEKCIKGHLKEKIYNNNSLKIKCPDDCGYILTQQNVEELLKEEIIILTKYKKFRLNAELSQNPNLVWCMQPGCENIIKVENNTNLIICSKCKVKMCLLCRSLWHEGQTCEEAIDSEYKRYIDNVAVKKCPKCKVRIEKNQGCNHMTCVRCHHQFCWICCKRYTPYHYKWYNLCGCPGLQDTERIKYVCLSRLNILLKMIACIFLGLLFVALLPIIWILSALIIPMFYVYTNYKGRCFPLFLLFMFLICVILLPVTMVVIFFLGVGLLIFNPKIFTLTNEE